MLPNQGNPTAQMLQDVRGSAKRAINYFHVIVDEVALNGTSGRLHVQLIGTSERNSIRDPLSYDVIAAESDDIFTDDGRMPLRRMITEAVAHFGLVLDGSSWSGGKEDEEQVVAVRRGG